jgi:hypothetical protein
MSPGVLLPKLSLVFFVLFPLANPRAWAQDSASPQPACPVGNLLAHKAPTAWQDVRRDLSLLTDETVAPVLPQPE